MRAGSSKQTIERFNWRLVTRLLGLPLLAGKTLALANTRIQAQIMDSEFVQKLMLPSGARASISTGERTINPGRLITRATLCKKALGELKMFKTLITLFSVYCGLSASALQAAPGLHGLHRVCR